MQHWSNFGLVLPCCNDLENVFQLTLNIMGSWEQRISSDNARNNTLSMDHLSLRLYAHALLRKIVRYILPLLVKFKWNVSSVAVYSRIVLWERSLSRHLREYEEQWWGFKCNNALNDIHFKLDSGGQFLFDVEL